MQFMISPKNISNIQNHDKAKFFEKLKNFLALLSNILTD